MKEIQKVVEKLLRSQKSAAGGGAGVASGGASGVANGSSVRTGTKT